MRQVVFLIYRKSPHNHLLSGDRSVTALSTDMTTAQLMRIAADHHTGVIKLSDLDKSLLLELLREKGREELDYGQEIEVGTVRLVKRVTGSVSVFFG